MISPYNLNVVNKNTEPTFYSAPHDSWTHPDVILTTPNLSPFIKNYKVRDALLSDHLSLDYTIILGANEQPEYIWDCRRMKPSEWTDMSTHADLIACENESGEIAFNGSNLWDDKLSKINWDIQETESQSSLKIFPVLKSPWS